MYVHVHSLNCGRLELSMTGRRLTKARIIKATQKPCSDYIALYTYATVGHFFVVCFLARRSTRAFIYQFCWRRETCKAAWLSAPPTRVEAKAHCIGGFFLLVFSFI